MSEFLPTGYEAPTPKSGYLKLKPGETRIRALSGAVVGWELWVGGKPLRSKRDDFTKDQLANADIDKFTGKLRLPEHFWAFVVWNYEEQQIQIFQTSKKKIQRGIEKYINDEEYGSPLGYNLKIIKEGEGKETEYSVIASPPKPLAPEIAKAYAETNINLESLFTGEDPFITQEEA